MVFSVTLCLGGENGAFYPSSQNLPLKYLSPTHKILAAVMAILQSRQSRENVSASNLTEVIERDPECATKNILAEYYERSGKMCCFCFLPVRLTMAAWCGQR